MPTFSYSFNWKPPNKRPTLRFSGRAATALFIISAASCPFRVTLIPVRSKRLLCRAYDVPGFRSNGIPSYNIEQCIERHFKHLLWFISYRDECISTPDNEAVPLNFISSLRDRCCWPVRSSASLFAISGNSNEIARHILVYTMRSGITRRQLQGFVN